MVGLVPRPRDADQLARSKGPRNLHAAHSKRKTLLQPINITGNMNKILASRSINHGVSP